MKHSGEIAKKIKENLKLGGAVYVIPYNAHILLKFDYQGLRALLIESGLL